MIYPISCRTRRLLYLYFFLPYVHAFAIASPYCDTLLRMDLLLIKLMLSVKNGFDVWLLMICRIDFILVHMVVGAS
jgi:hypothetical protein